MIYLAILEYAILASTFTLGKIALGYADPLFLIGIRMVIAAPLVFITHKLSNKSATNKIKKEHLWLFFVVSIVHMFIPFVGEFWSLQYLSSAKTAIIFSFTPFIAAILSYFLLGTKLKKIQTIGLIIGFAGLLPIIITSDDLNFSWDFFALSLPEFVLLISVISASYAWFLIFDLMKKGYGIGLINSFAMLVGGVLSLLCWLLFSDKQYTLVGNIDEFIFWLLLLVIVANVISYNFYGWLISKISINLMSAIGFLCPIFASIYGAVFLRESIGYLHFISLFSVMIGLFLFYNGEFKKNSYEQKQ